MKYYVRTWRNTLSHLCLFETRLNSTLSMRIEELNAEITILQVENLRLRQSEISLLTQLKREREKSRKVMADAEAAVCLFFLLLRFLPKGRMKAYVCFRVPFS